MNDQAEKLRRIMNSNKKDDINQQVAHKAKVIAITSGKGGVGKTNIAVNLAISIKRLGYSVLVLDADLGLANVEIMIGTNIKHTISDCILTDLTIEDIIAEGPAGIKIISGGSGFHELSIMNDNNIKKFIKELEKLENNFDFIIIDTGAGVSNVVLNFVISAHEVILVTTADPTSIIDGYAMLKALTTNEYKGKINIVINMVNDRKEAYDTYNTINKVANNFLSYDLNFLGYLERSDIVDKAVKMQTPFLLSNPRSLMSKKINVIALKLVDKDSYGIKDERKSFASKLKELFIKKGGTNDN